MRGYFPLIQKDSLTHILGLAVYVKKGLSWMAFPPLGNSNYLVVSVSIDFLSNSKRDAPFHLIAYDYSRADRRVGLPGGGGVGAPRSFEKCSM